VRPLIGKLKGKGQTSAPPAEAAALAESGDEAVSENAAALLGQTDNGIPLEDLPRQVELARRLAASQPERAVEALQRMLEAPDNTDAEARAA
jgi:flagellar M-ring protein FliF